MDCTVLILTYKGKRHLQYLLPTVKEAIENSPDFHINVLIVDNGRDEDTKLFVKSDFPEYRYEYSLFNDYLFSLNVFVKELQSQFVLILNDDMRLGKTVFNDCLPLLRKDVTLFSVNCRLLNWDGNGQQNNVRLLNLSRGWASSFWREEQSDFTEYTLYGGGGAAFFRVSMFNILGGFDDYFRPAYCEDLDLGYRAWLQGWTSVILPSAIIYHRDGATIKEQHKNQSSLLTRKIYTNQVKWMLRDIQQPFFKFWFFLFLPKRILFGWIQDRNSWIGLIKGTYAYLRAEKKKIIVVDEFSNSILIENYIGKLYKE